MDLSEREGTRRPGQSYGVRREDAAEEAFLQSGLAALSPRSAWDPGVGGRSPNPASRCVLRSHTE